MLLYSSVEKVLVVKDPVIKALLVSFVYEDNPGMVAVDSKISASGFNLSLMS